MPEDFEQEDGPESIDWERYLGIARRRTWYFLVPFFIVWLVFWGAGWVMPSVYRSSELIIVQEATVPTNLVPSNIAGSFQDRLASITQQIMSTTQLLHIIQQYNLYSDERVHRSPDELVDRMKKDIDLELVHSPDQQLSSFRIYYSSRNPVTAQQVTSELTNLFINENLAVRESQSHNITEFLESQLEQARQALSAQETKVREFNQAHMGELPEQMSSNLSILNGLQAQMQNEQTALNNANEHNVYLQSLISQYSAMSHSVKTVGGQTVVGGLPAIDAELQRLQAQLADLSSRYTDQYPDVKKVKEQIAQTERTKHNLEEQLKASAANPSSAQDTAASGNGDPGPTPELQSQLKANQIEINNRQLAIKQLEVKINEYQARLNASPALEQQLTELNRGYNQSKADYDALLEKKNQADMANNSESILQGEHFRIQDPANVPTRPYSPNRLKLFIEGLFAGLVVGAVAALGMEFMDNRIYTEAEFKQIVPTEVLVEIPMISTTEEESAQKRTFRYKIAATAAVAFSLFVAFAITFLHG